MDVLEELTEFEPQIDKERVERRVEDWIARVESLYAKIGSWLPQGWTAERLGKSPMNEELMRKFGVGERELPILRLRRDGNIEATMEPRGLWIIGANGRVDFVRADVRSIIVDQAQIFETPEWTVAPFMHRLDRRPLDRASFQNLLA